MPTTPLPAAPRQQEQQQHIATPPPAYYDKNITTNSAIETKTRKRHTKEADHPISSENTPMYPLRQSEQTRRASFLSLTRAQRTRAHFNPQLSFFVSYGFVLVRVRVQTRTPTGHHVTSARTVIPPPTRSPPALPPRSYLPRSRSGSSTAPSPTRLRAAAAGPRAPAGAPPPSVPRPRSQDAAAPP